jgi:hypothetical protein
MIELHLKLTTEDDGMGEWRLYTTESEASKEERDVMKQFVYILRDIFKLAGNEETIERVENEE